MNIVYTGPYTEVDLDGIVCKNGELVAFPDSIAKSALEQDCWNAPDSRTVKGNPPKEDE